MGTQVSQTGCPRGRYRGRGMNVAPTDLGWWEPWGLWVASAAGMVTQQQRWAV